MCMLKMYSLPGVYTFLLLMLCSVVHCTSNPTLKPIRNGTYQHGQYMQAYVIRSFQNYGPSMCLRSCSRYSGCNGINYQSTPKLLCELLRVSGRSTLAANKDFRYSELSWWIMELNACWPNPCTSHNHCVVTDNGIPMCAAFQSNLDGLKNVALGRPAYMSSQYDVYSPSYGNDGNYDTMFHTQPSGYNYWYVDLGSSYDIHRVELFNRDIAPERLQNVNVTIGTSLDTMQLCGYFKGPGVSRQHVVIICPVWMVGRYVKLYQRIDMASSILHVFEVAIFGYEL